MNETGSQEKGATEGDCQVVATEPILNIAAYQFARLDDLPTLRQQLKSICDRLRLKGTILLSSEGINLFVAGPPDAIASLLERIRAIPGLERLLAKESWTAEQPFHRMLVKLKKEIIAFGIDAVRPAEHTSPKLSAKVLRQWLAEGRAMTLLDTRNDYEIQLGTFQKAIDLRIKHFRDFPKEAARLPEEIKNQPVVMFCTGGIRCEKAGPFMEGLGFREVYQLDGGILKYFEECGGDFYDGSCFVFDQRVAVGPDLQPTGDAQCFACQATLKPADLESPKFRMGVSCPHCYREPELIAEERLARRQARIDAVAGSLPGCTPYLSVRVMHVPRALAGLSAIEFLCRFHPGIERKRWLDALDAQTIRSQSQPIHSDTVVREGERLEHSDGTVVEPVVATGIKLLYEDDALVVVDKPAPLPCHASGRFFKNTLEHFLAEAYRPEKLRMAHRLDANTSGVMVFSRRYQVAKRVQSQFEERTVDKLYLAKVAGIPDSEVFSCQAAIAREPDRHGSRSVQVDGRMARTDFRLLDRCSDGTSLIEVRPVTGRTNQIRIHLWQMGLPIVGDPLYRSERAIGGQSTLDIDDGPMCLHAWKISLDHPITGQRMDFETKNLPAWVGGDFL